MKYIYLFMVSILAFTTGFCSFKGSVKPRSGDLIFTGTCNNIDEGEFSAAINEVTSEGVETNFTHVGIIEIDEQGAWVIHAEPRDGVVRESLFSFMDSEAGGKAFVYRLKPEYRKFVPDALHEAMGYLGQPYDFAFSLSDTAQYCSGLIYRLFKQHEVFSLEPMTFIDPSTGTFHPFWVEYFDNLGTRVPEGEPGCNPNGLAASNAIDFVGVIRQ